MFHCTKLPSHTHTHTPSKSCISKGTNLKICCHPTHTRSFFFPSSAIRFQTSCGVIPAVQVNRLQSKSQSSRLMCSHCTARSPSHDPAAHTAREKKTRRFLRPRLLTVVNKESFESSLRQVCLLALLLIRQKFVLPCVPENTPRRLGRRGQCGFVRFVERIGGKLATFTTGNSIICATVASSLSASCRHRVFRCSVRKKGTERCGICTWLCFSCAKNLSRPDQMSDMSGILLPSSGWSGGDAALRG